ncbi:hypothetical protein ECG_07945 [Echinococcus granulosus]|nr:hypothetical protein ECG_07945 [Echinococcus granulosus]
MTFIPSYLPFHFLRLLLTWICLVALVMGTREQNESALAPHTSTENTTLFEDEIKRTQEETAKQPENRAICPKCQGRSLCLVSPSGKASCFCPPDRIGEFCELEIVKLPTACTKDQCENGGVCDQGPITTICYCSENYVGANCSRVAVWIKLSMNLYENGKLVDWSKQNKSKPLLAYAACNQVTASILRGPNPTIATAFMDCDLQEYHKILVGNQEGVRVTTMLKFDPGDNAKALRESEVRRHIESSTYNIDFDSGETISVTNYDVCEAHKHDCSPSASCIWDGITYSCECNRFYSDGFVTGKLLPGRDCYHSFMTGFLLGCLIILPIIITTFTGLDPHVGGFGWPPAGLLSSHFAFYFDRGPVSPIYGVFIAATVMAPFVVASIMLFFWIQNRQFRRFWILPTSEQGDQLGLVDYPRHSFTV